MISGAGERRPPPVPVQRRRNVGYEDSDVLWFYGIILFFIVLYLFRSRSSGTTASRSADPPADRPGGEPTAPAGRAEQPGAPPPESGPSEPAPSPTAPETVQEAILGFTERQAGAGTVTGVLVAVTVWDPQVQMMAMSLSTQILAKGKSVRILLCGPGGELALKEGKEVIIKPLNVSPRTLLKNLIQKGVKVEVCPFFLAERGGSPADLLDGVAQANPPLVADAILAPGTKLFTF